MKPGIYVLTGYLMICSITDFRYRRISVILSAITGIAGIVLSICSGREAGDVILALLPGAALILTSLVTRGEIGMGDGIAAAVMGCCMEYPQIFEALLAASLYAAVFAIILLLRKRSRGASFPYLPFLLAGFLTGRLL